MSEKPPARLTKRAVADRALQLADSSGLEGLTIRKLAADLGVTPMALYWHFRSKEELLDGLAERLWSEIDVAVDPATAWLAQLRTLLESLIALRATELTLEILRAGGFDPEHASAIARSALWTGIMLVTSEPGADTLPGKDRVELQQVKQIKLATLPPDSYPQLVECAIPMTSCADPAFHYEFDVGLFIAGVEAMAARGGHP